MKELPNGDGIYIYFECNDLDAQVGELRANGIEFQETPSDRPWLWREARLKDLDNNKLLLFYGGENRKNPTWRIPDPS